MERSPNETPYFPQIDGVDCAHSCVRMAHAKLGIPASRIQIASELPPHPVMGVDNDELASYLQRRFDCEISIDTTVHQLIERVKSGLFVVVNFLTARNPARAANRRRKQYRPLPKNPAGIDGHYGVVVHADQNHLHIHDPEIGPEIAMSTSEFETERWRSQYGAQARRWMAAISGPKKAA